MLATSRCKWLLWHFSNLSVPDVKISWGILLFGAPRPAKPTETVKGESRFATVLGLMDDQDSIHDRGRDFSLFLRFSSSHSPVSPSLLSKWYFRSSLAASMKMTVFWDVAPCSLVEIGLRFRGAYCLHHQGDDFGAHGIIFMNVCCYNRCHGNVVKGFWILPNIIVFSCKCFFVWTISMCMRWLISIKDARWFNLFNKPRRRTSPDGTEFRNKFPCFSESTNENKSFHQLKICRE
jgi:hypothetical protein